MTTTYINHWQKFLVEHSLRCPWLSLYSTTPPPPTESILVKDVDKPLEDDEDEDKLNCEDPADPEFGGLLISQVASFGFSYCTTMFFGLCVRTPSHEYMCFVYYQSTKGHRMSSGAG